MRVIVLAASLASLAGCAGAAMSMVVKPPLQSQCQRLPIRGCGELVDGVLLYVQGDKPGALAKIKQAKDKNVPAQLKPFAQALREIAKLPGADDYAQTMNEIADLLDTGGATKVDAPPVPVSADARVAAAAAVPEPEETSEAKEGHPIEREPSQRRDDLVARALSASVDPMRLLTETTDLSTAEGRTPCKIDGLDALCLKARQGPLVVTDVIGPRACPDRIFIGASESDTPEFGFRWLIESAPSPLTGARLIVRGGDWLQLAIVPGKKGLSASSECGATWSAFRPWIVPGQ